MESISTTTSNIKFDWYQTDQKIVITIPAKNVTQDCITVLFSLNSVSVDIKLPIMEKNSLNLNLSSNIVPEKCSFKLFPSKVEITLVKEFFSRWETLVKSDNQSLQTELTKKSTSKNWDAVAKGLIDEKEEESSVETLFSKIYSDGSDDQKRAMIKSFYESGGTVLSTNWSEVGKKKVDVKPPNGVEFKSWN
ncbi:hypothetical protein PGB90_008295 [Kerria lacca]